MKSLVLFRSLMFRDILELTVIQNISTLLRRQHLHIFVFILLIGKIGPWGFPIRNSFSKSKFPFYSIGGFASEGKIFDFYMVDGRFRLACVFAIFLHASSHDRNSSEYLVGVHDFGGRHNTK